MEVRGFLLASQEKDGGQSDSETFVAIATRDGSCPSYVFAPPPGTEPRPGVLVFMDGLTGTLFVVHYNA